MDCSDYSDFFDKVFIDWFDLSEMKYKELIKEIIGIFYRVYNVLGYGFLERVYENALKIEFRKAGLKFENQVPVRVYYEGEVVGDYVAAPSLIGY